MRHARLRTENRSGARGLCALLLSAALVLSGSGTALADVDEDAELRTLTQQEAEVERTSTEVEDVEDDQDASNTPTGSDEGAGIEEEPGEQAESDQGMQPDDDESSASQQGDEDAEPAGDGESADPAESEPATEDEELGTLAVPPAGGGNAVITVKVGGDRSGASSVGSLAGVRLRLYDGGSSGPANPVGQDWAECVSDADGDCSFTVPETQARQTVRGDCIRWFIICLEYEQIEVTPLGENRDSQFWVVLESAPDGWYANQALVTGTATGQQTTDYQFRTGNQLRAGNTYRSGSHFMSGSGNNTRDVSSGTWQLSRSNPPLTSSCQAGLDVALVLDLSGSVANAGATGDLKNAAIGFTEALEGTDSSLALYTFATTAPRNGTGSGRNYGLMPIDDNVETITSRINGYAAEGGTNWDRGIHQVATSGNNYDLAVVVTDGLPTFYGTGSNPSGPGSFTRFVEAEEAIYSANAVKSQGTRMLAVGVGDGISGSPANLAAISGPNGYASGASINSADYFQASWQQLLPLLEDVARGATCQASITVDKIAEPYGGQAGPGEGWDFEATRTAGTGELTPNGTQSTGADGELSYTVQFDSMSGSASIHLAELMSTAQVDAGWHLDQVTCTVNDAPVNTTVENDGVALTGLGVGDDAVCTFTNIQRLVPDIDLVKRAWDTTAGPIDPADPSAPEITAGDQVVAGSTITWTYTVTNTGQTDLAGISVSDDQDVDVTCPSNELAPGHSMTCWGSGPVHALDP